MHNMSFNKLTISTEDTGKYLNFSELELYDMNDDNVALLGTASASSTHSGSASLGNDGNTANVWTVEADTPVFHSHPGAVWTLDLDRVYTKSDLQKAVFYNRYGLYGESDRTIGAVVTLHSPDGVTTEEVGVCNADLVQTFTITEKTLLYLTPSITKIGITMIQVGGAIAYKLTVNESGSSEITTILDGARGVVDEHVAVVKSLKPGTAYVVTMYVNSGDGYAQVFSETIQTRPNSAESYDLSEFGSNGLFDLSGTDETARTTMTAVMNDLFSTGDKLRLMRGGKKTTLTFVREGESVTTDNPVLLPFAESLGGSQTVTLQLSNNSTSTVTYDETANSITIGGAEHQGGEAFVFDGKKCTVEEI